MRRLVLLAIVIAAGCHLGKGMSMPPVQSYVVPPDPRSPSEIDPLLHVSTGPNDGGAPARVPTELKPAAPPATPPEHRHPGGSNEGAQDTRLGDDHSQFLRPWNGLPPQRSAPEIGVSVAMPEVNRRNPTMKRLLLPALAAATLAGTPAIGNAQSAHAQTSPQTSVSPSGSESEVVWLRKRVEQLQAQLASGSNCSPGMRQKGKQAQPSSAAPMGDQQMGTPPAGMGPMNGQPSDQGKMKGHDHSKMNNGNMQQNSGGMQDM